MTFWFFVGAAVGRAIFGNARVRRALLFMVLLFGGSYVYTTLQKEAAHAHVAQAAVEFGLSAALTIGVLAWRRDSDVVGRILLFALAVITGETAARDVWGRTLTEPIQIIVFLACVATYVVVTIYGPSLAIFNRESEKEHLYQRYQEWQRAQLAGDRDTTRSAD